MVASLWFPRKNCYKKGGPQKITPKWIVARPMSCTQGAQCETTAKLSNRMSRKCSSCKGSSICRICISVRWYTWHGHESSAVGLTSTTSNILKVVCVCERVYVSVQALWGQDIGHSSEFPLPRRHPWNSPGTQHPPSRQQVEVKIVVQGRPQRHAMRTRLEQSNGQQQNSDGVNLNNHNE